MSHSKEEINEALVVFNLDENATPDEIIDKAKQLSDTYKTSKDSSKFQKLSEIHEATQILLANNPGQSSKGAESSGSFFGESTPKKSEQDKSRYVKKRKKLAFIALGVFLLLLAVAIPTSISRYRAKQYSELETLMMNVEKFNVEEIGETIEKIPSEYKDMSTIKKRYELIMREVKMIEDNSLPIDYERMRIAYYNLKTIDEFTSNWDLSEYIDNRDKRIQLYGINWTNDDQYMTFVTDINDPTDFLMGSSLLNNRTEGEDYYFTHDENYTFLGYKNKNDVADRFNAFRILSINEEQIRVYCYADKETYTLYAQ